MVRSMADQSRMFQQTMFGDSEDVTGSPALEFGTMPSTWPDGETEKSGPDHAPAPVSVAPGKERDLATLVTSGHIGFNSSASFALQRSLASKLVRRLDMAGSTLFTLTWKERATPLGRRYLERAVSVLRTSGKGCTSVPMPQVHDKQGPKTEEQQAAMKAKGHGVANLNETAMLSSVPTPAAQEPGGTQEMFLARRRNAAARGISIGKTSQGHMSHVAQLATVPTPMAGSAAGNNDYSRKIVELATTPSPMARDYRSVTGREHEQRDHATQNLNVVASLAGVTTPSARDWKDSPGMSETGVDPDGSTRTRLDQLPRQAQLATSGETATGGTAETASIGQLNAAYSRWLQGLPAVFDKSAILAWRNLKTRRKRES